MRLRPVLTREQVELIHRNALRVLAEVGVRVEHAKLREQLGAIGAQRDAAAETVRFAPARVEQLIANAKKTPMRDDAAEISFGCGVYQCLYHDPETGALVDFDEQKLAGYIALARSIPEIGAPGLLGVPFVPKGMTAELLPLAEKLYAWKHGAHQGQSVQRTELCEPILEMFKCHATHSGKRLEDVVRACGYLISPLKVARPECEQVLWFHERGLTMHLGHLPTQGGTAPVTLAGSMVLALAEQIFLFLFRRAFDPQASFDVGGSVATLDMRRVGFCYGRPEQVRINAAFADLARFYGCACGGHTGATDAKSPSVEAGAQKATGALITALATGHGHISAGLLSADEVCSPVQMILDHDLGMSLRALLAPVAVDEVECAFEEIQKVGIAGNHLGTDFTAERFRSCLFQPQTWSAQLVSAWQASGRKLDVDGARQRVVDFLRKFEPASHISAEEERDLRQIIRRAGAR